MKFKNVCVFILSFCFTGAIASNEISPDTQRVVFKNGISFVYEKPKMFHWGTHIPGDIGNCVKTSFKKESLPMTGVVLGSTTLGDGFTYFTLIAGFWDYGKFGHKYRSLQTSS